ncbi:hypothetical protein [Kytococcus sedentarius]|uniref:hypothetical protein n=1 Tax=Kytococcus sedentarius TaxID=1276 RepID=UPI00194F4A31|nr:hypothetical protein [Kytococcus sedentarius]QRO87507.1 hypothetical protein I6J30_00540 [Kytococcus sedentarius]
MENTTHTPNAREAQAALDSASGARVTSGKDLSTLRFTAAAVSLAMAAALVLFLVTSGNPAGLIITMSVYMVAIITITTIAQKARSVPRGYTRQYSLAVLASSLLYGVGILVSVLTEAPLWLMIGLAVLVALPGVIVATRLGKSAR